MSTELPDGLLDQVVDELATLAEEGGPRLWDGDGRAWLLGCESHQPDEVTLTPLSQGGAGEPVRLRVRVERL